ncbi:gag polyprotein, partial [Trifolium medium]|nr:gag polyprotein [Trifolium medium]
MAQSMANMADAVTAQTAAKNLRDLEKRDKALQNEESKGLIEFRHHKPPKFRGDVSPEEAGLWLQEIEKIFE